jgi:methionyl-tRNA formyltransferase
VRVVYFGTPAESVPPLRALVAAGHEVALVVTQPDRRRGRGAEHIASPVKQAALELGLAVRTPQRARELTDEVAALAADVGVVVAFGQILPQALLDTTRLGFVNVHFSLLPRWRGAAPVERAILAGDTETGVGIMQMEAGLDTGPVYAEERTPIGADETSAELGARLVALGTDLLVTTLPNLGSLVARAQDGDATYADKVAPEQFVLDVDRPAVELARVVRAGNPRPGAWCRVGGRRIKVLRAAAVPSGPPPGVVDADAVVGTVDGGLRLVEVQPEGKPTMGAMAWRNGQRGEVRIDPTG